MSTTVSQIRLNALDLLDEPQTSAGIPSVATALRMVNDARKRLAVDCHYSEDSYSFSMTAYGSVFALPDDVIRIKRVKWLRDTVVDAALTENKSIKDWEALSHGNVSTGTDLTDYFIRGRDLEVYPRVTSAADTDALNGGINASVTTITLDDTSWLPKEGRVKIDNEKIWYKYRSDTVLYGCVRGAEGTTAATHSDDAVVTELNLVVYYYKLPTDLSAISSTIEPVLAQYPGTLEFWLCWKAKIKDMDDASGYDGAGNKSAMFRQMWEDEKARLRQHIFGVSDEQFSIREV